VRGDRVSRDALATTSFTSKLDARICGTKLGVELDTNATPVIMYLDTITYDIEMCYLSVVASDAEKKI
jgi:hypothetical protein